MLSRPETQSPDYDYTSAYKAPDVPEELRGYYHEFSIQKTLANKWLAANDIPLVISFKPKGEFIEESTDSNMELHVFYLIGDGKWYRIGKRPLSKNRIRIDCHRNAILKMTLKCWDRSNCKDKVEGIARANAAYEAAYAL